MTRPYPLRANSPIIISSYGRYFAGIDLELMSGTGLQEQAITWPATNRAIYVPFTIPFEYTVQRMFWMNGSTVTGNIDIGVYTGLGALISAKGSTAQSGATAPQFVTPASVFTLMPGTYYLGIVVSATTANLLRGSTIPVVNRMESCGLLQEDLGSTALPSSMTPAAISSAIFPFAGLTRDSAKAF